MRFYEFKILKEAEAKVIAVGDSLAVGVAGAGAINGGSRVGAPPSEVLTKIKDLVSSQDVNGAIVVVGTGVPNNPSQLNLVAAQLQLLVKAGATPVVLGVGPKFEQYSQALKSVASQGGARVIDINSLDPNIAKGDGIHPGPQGYSAILNAAKGTQLRPPTAKPPGGGAQPVQGTDPTTPTKTDPTGKSTAQPFTVDVPGPGRKGVEIADLQKALMALGYPLPQYGVDGIVGSETRTAVKAFQRDNKLAVDGSAGPETIAALNNVLKSKPDVASKLTKSTAADVKSSAQVPDFKDLKSNAKSGAGATGSAKEAVQFFIGKGWTAEQASGIVGNLQAESGSNLKIDSVGDSGQAYGIAQWHPDRQAKFKKAFSKDIRDSNFQEQLAFVNWELEHDEIRAGSAIKKAKTAEEAAWLFDEYYERSSGAHRQKRIDNAVALLSTTSTTA
jgi:peptidoglycan hydrolase-like protein with peptidoglycan-binding domain